MKSYFTKLRGGGKSPAIVPFVEVIWSFFGSVIGIGLCAFISSYYLDGTDLTLLIGSFGASAVLVYAAIASPLAQPRNLLGGHVISALIGVAIYKLFGGTWYSAALAVSLAISAMLITGTLHPPGGATALIAVIGSAKIHNLGYLYAFIPAGLGAIILLVVALIVNNLSPRRRYPEYWF
ncbi:MAG: HPP family protein [Spirochaetota bacterium]|nr:HPP family protein [Spirochaetota bacterium]